MCAPFLSRCDIKPPKPRKPPKNRRIVDAHGRPLSKKDLAEHDRIYYGK